MGFQIGVTENEGPLVHTEDDFDKYIYNLIQSQMRTSQTNLKDLLDLCKTIYKNLLKKEIPQEKLNELRKYLLTYSKASRGTQPNGSNTIFYKQ